MAAVRLFSRPPVLLCRPLVNFSSTALDRLRESQRQESEAFDAKNKAILEQMPEQIKQQLAEITRLRKNVDELVDVLNEHEFLGEGELLAELQSSSTQVDIGAELHRMTDLNRRLVRRLEEVDAVLGANPC